MPFGNRVWRIHILVSVPVSRGQHGNGRSGILNRLHPARFNLEAISFELKLPVLVIPGAAPQLHP